MVDIDQIIVFIQENFKKYGYKGAVIGISGGIDSAVAAALTVKAISSENVLGLLMPDRDSAKDTLNHSKLVAEHFGSQ